MRSYPLPTSPSSLSVAMIIPAFISRYPGVLWLLFSFPRIVAPAFLVYLFISSALGLLVGWDSLQGSRWKVAVSSALAFPLAFFCSITWNRFKIAYRARRIGAITPSVVAGKFPGSLDLAWLIAKSRFTAYPGEQSRASRLLRLCSPLQCPRCSLLFLILLRTSDTYSLPRRPYRRMAERKRQYDDLSDFFRGSSE